MAKYYLDFVGLNTFIYEPVGYDPENQVGQNGNSSTESKQGTVAGAAVHLPQTLNHIGIINPFSSNPLSPDLYTNEWYGFALKNFPFSHDLPNTASYFPALMIHRNGPYGYPTWKQIRNGDNPLIRKQIKNNIMTTVQEPGQNKTHIQNGVQEYDITDKFGQIRSFVETPISNKGKPLVIYMNSIEADPSDGSTRLVASKIMNSYTNNTIFFDNDDINLQYNTIECRPEDYENLKNFYLNDSKCDPSKVSVLEYRRSIYPPSIYAYKCYSRQRTAFHFPWRDNTVNRRQLNVHDGFTANTSSTNNSILVENHLHYL